MKVKPLKNHLLVQIIENEDRTKSGIILAGGAKGPSNLAKILETPDCIEDNQDIFLKGDTLLIDPNAGVDITLDGTSYLLISTDDILAVVQN